MKSPYVKAQDIEPGQQFDFHGARYIRATEDEAGWHPARELQRERPSIVLVYMLGRGANTKRTPSSFLPNVDVIPR